MKAFYYVFPLVLLAGFSAYFWQFNTASEAAAKVAAEKAAIAKSEEEAKKKAEAMKAREDSEKRTAARLAEEKAREDEKVGRFETETKRLVDEATGYKNEVDALTAEIRELEAKLASLKNDKDTKSRALLAAARDVENAAIEKYRAEMEIQRMNELLVRKAAGTSLVKIAKQ